MGSRLTRVFGCAALAVAAAASPAAAQETTASVRGRVSDSDGRGIGGVAITAQSSELIRPVTTTTTPAGEYVLRSLPSGPYVVAFAREGLVTVKRTLWLSAAEAATANVLMRPTDGFDGAITVIDERLAFAPSEATSLDTRAALRHMPVTGTLRSIIGLTTGLDTARPSASLLLFDGLPLRHGWRVDAGDAFAGPGPETIQELTSVPAGLPAGYGRLEAGTIALVTSSGTNRIAAAARADVGSAGLTADLLRSSQSIEGVGRTIEYTLGGPILRNSTWFFASGRHLAESAADDTAVHDHPFETRVRERFGVGRLTHMLSSSQRLEAQWVGARHQLADTPPADAVRVADLRALETRALSDRAFSAAYVGLLGRRVLLTARYTREDGTAAVEALGAEGESLVEQTGVIDQQTGVRAWASGGCAACDPRRTSHHTVRVTAAALLPGRLASHHITMGADAARDAIEPASHPPGGRFGLHASRFATDGNATHPVFEPGGSSWITWFPNADQRIRLRSDAAFISDRWSVTDLLTVGAGLRIDRHRGTAVADGAPILAQQGFSPRLSAAWRPTARLPWTLTAAYGRYLESPLARGIDASLPDVPARRVFVYDGAPINTASVDRPSPQAVSQVFDWFFASGGTSRPAWFATSPGISTTAPETIAAPRVDEWAIGLGRVLGEDGHARADLVGRTYDRFSTRRVLDSQAGASDRSGLPIDVGRLMIDERLEQRYVGLTLTGDYRFGHWADVGARYTLSSLRGNTGDQRFGGDVPAAGVLAYPEFTMPDWHLPVGAVPDDARHRTRVWLHSELIANEAQGTLMLSLLFRTESGRPYGASGLVGVAPHVASAPFQQPPIAARYYFTARDERRTPMMMRADIGFSYRRRAPGTVHGELFTQFDVLNLLGTLKVRNPERLTLVRTAFTEPSLQPFNPFTETPVEGVHWTFDDANVRRSTAGESLAATMGRAVRISFGIRY
jgi:hypothetical protein